MCGVDIDSRACLAINAGLPRKYYHPVAFRDVLNRLNLEVLPVCGEPQEYFIENFIRTPEGTPLRIERAVGIGPQDFRIQARQHRCRVSTSERIVDTFHYIFVRQQTTWC